MMMILAKVDSISQSILDNEKQMNCQPIVSIGAI